jgi:hypothetical protein
MNSHYGSWNPKWTPKFLEHNCSGQNPSVWRFFYIIKNKLKFKCLKWAHMTHLDIWNTNYDQKKGREWRLKVGNWPDFLAIYHWKALDKGYNFASYLIAIGGLHAKLWAPKVARIPIARQNAIWMCPPWRGVKNTIRGKVMASPKFGSWWVLWIQVCPWFILALKVLKLCINQLIV